MNNKKIILIQAFLLLFGLTVSAQEKILLLNGKILKVKSVIVNETSPVLTFKCLKREKEKKINRERVFSVFNEAGMEKIIYKQDSLSINNDLSIPEMHMYIKGLQEADTFRSPLATTGGFLIGAGSSVLSFYGPIVPAVYLVIIGARSPDMKNLPVSDKELLKDENFVAGYQKKCRNRKVNNAAIAGISGFVAGFITLAIIYKN